jgi:hypothetical protein
MSMSPEQESFVRQASALLDEAQRRIPQSDLARLQTARRRAMAGQRRAMAWPTLGGALALASLAAILALRTPNPELDEAAPPLAQPLELLASAEGLAFYEDLAFVEWLEQAEYGAD